MICDALTGFCVIVMVANALVANERQNTNSHRLY